MLAPIYAENRRNSLLSNSYYRSPQGVKNAWLVAAVENDLPESEWHLSDRRPATPPVQPSRT